MAIKEAYLSQLGRNYKVSDHFTLGEIASRDGADKVLYDTDLLDMWENVRFLLGGDGVCALKPNSWYRTPAHNRAQGGASNSQHIYGTAADMVVYQNGKIVDARLICCLLQDLGFPGVAYISPRAVHSDNRASGTYRGDERKGYRDNVEDFYEYFGIKKEQVQALIVNKPAESEEEMIYKDITEVPEWGQASVQLRLDHGWSDCKDIEHSLLRSWVTLDKENPYIADMEDVKKHAEWAIPEVQRLFDMSKLKGTGAEPIAMRLNELRVCIINNR